MKLVIAAICASALASSANGAVTCSEAIASVILHANGNVYFRTDKTCNTVWCQIEWGSSESNRRALAALLLARSTNKPMQFYWPNLSSCTDANPVFAVPAYFIFD